MSNKGNEEPPQVPSSKRIVNIIFGGEEINKVTFTIAKKFTKCLSCMKIILDRHYLEKA